MDREIDQLVDSLNAVRHALGLGPTYHRDDLSRETIAGAQKLHADLAAARAEIERVRESMADDLRALGLSVAVHNDYSQDGIGYTFWLLTANIDGVRRAFKGEGTTDTESLNQIREQYRALSRPATGGTT